LEGEIKLLEKKKKALQDQLEEYKKYIAAQKESLKRMKEEKDFTDELMKKNLDLAKLKARITILSLDDSEEATAERLKLEEEAGQLETEITKDKEDRKYELQIQALDDLEKAFEEMINKQIEAIDLMIEKLRDQMDALKEGSSSGANTIVKNNDKIKMSYAGMMATITQMMKDTFGEIDVAHQAWVDETVEGMLRQGKSYDEILEKLREMLRLQDELSKKEGTTPPPVIPPPTDNKKHEGEIVEQHHGGEFAGKLKSNEVFSKLLKGEYVATEGQMSNFMGNILPRIANQPTGTSIKNGETNISMPIHVEGNLDKSVLPDLEKMMNKTFEKMNAALMSRGYKRSTDQVL
jgi:chromosome segregation ATPase